ncbi:MAG TPA: PIG-L family deacetylase [Anaerolineae bacterium]|nr:PIG-L family deacetylase [Anaerolineae bacterium]
MSYVSVNSRQIFLSPHPDDAVLSCGGWIYQLAQNGERPIVITIFGDDAPVDVLRSDFARSLQERWQMGDDAPAHRRDEDRAACDRLGCYLIHLPFADAVYRVDESGRALYASEEAIFSELHETAIVDRVVEALHARVERVLNARLVIPLTAGKHIDHVITRQAAERLNMDSIYYEDYPYAEQPERMLHVWGAAENARDDWGSETIGLSEDALNAKIEAFLLHRSQISTFYQDEDEVSQRMHAYAELVGHGSPAERYWHKP